MYIAVYMTYLLVCCRAPFLSHCCSSCILLFMQLSWPPVVFSVSFMAMIFKLICAWCPMLLLQWLQCSSLCVIQSTVRSCIQNAFYTAGYKQQLKNYSREFDQELNLSEHVTFVGHHCFYQLCTNYC